MALHARWTKVYGVWYLKILKDEYNSTIRPLEGDKVLVEYRNGEVTEKYIGRFRFEYADSWIFEEEIPCDEDDLSPWSYDDYFQDDEDFWNS
jgi:hypothetical protein